MSILTGPWSHSRATSCSLALYKQKVLKVPEEPRPERLLELDRRAYGQILHDALELFIKSALELEPQDDHLKDIWKRLGGGVDHKMITTELMGLKEYHHLADEAVEIERRVEMIVTGFRNRGMSEKEHVDHIKNNCLGSELRLAFDADWNEVDFFDCPEDGWRGIIDYIERVDENTILIVDGKNRPAIHNREEMLHHEQLSGYAKYAKMKFPQIENVQYGIYYFQFGYEQIMEVEWPQIEENFKRLERRAELKSQMKEEDIAPEPGFGKCQYCDYLASCPAGQEITDSSELVANDMAAAKRLAEWLVVTEEKVKTVKNGLKKFTGEYGSIMLDDATGVGHNETESVEWDKNKALSVLKRMGYKIAGYTSLNTVEVKKLLKKEEMAEALKPAMKPIKKTMFKVFRAKKPKAVKGRVKSKARK